MSIVLPSSFFTIWCHSAVMNLKVSVGFCTDKGPIRDLNEDAGGFITANEALQGVEGVFVVADGLGGHDGGEVASKMAVEVVLDAYRVGSTEIGTLLPIEQSIIDVIHKANEQIYEFSMASVSGEALHRDPDRSSMGTTVTVAILSREKLTIGHVGDSRAYLKRKGTLSLLTDDQTLAAEQVREGNISSDALRDHPLRNVLTQAVGTAETVKPFVRTEKIQSGDIFLLCSDGLYDVLSDRVLLRMIDGSNESQKVVDSLVQKAIEDGSTDNVTALIAYITN